MRCEYCLEPTVPPGSKRPICKDCLPDIRRIEGILKNRLACQERYRRVHGLPAPTIDGGFSLFAICHHVNIPLTAQSTLSPALLQSRQEPDRYFTTIADLRKLRRTVPARRNWLTGALIQSYRRPT